MIKERKIYLDLLRIIAILFVIYNHTNEKGYYLYAFDGPMPLKILYIATGGLVAVAVPIFFMISGSLLIPKEESIKDLYIKRVLRILVVLIIFSIVQYVFQILVNNENASIMSFLDKILTDSITPAYWYLYAYLAYLICLPFLRKLAVNMSNDEFKYLFVVFLIIEGGLTSLLYIFYKESYNSFFVIPFFNRVVLYPLLGYYMECRIDDSKYTIKGVLKCILCMILVLALIVIMTIIRNLPYEEFTTYDKGLFTTGFTIILDVGVFYIVKLLFKKIRSTKTVNITISTIGGTVFGTYLIENMVRYMTENVYEELSFVVGHFIAAWIWVIVVFIICSVIVYLVRLIPIVRRFI